MGLSGVILNLPDEISHIHPMNPQFSDTYPHAVQFIILGKKKEKKKKKKRYYPQLNLSRSTLLILFFRITDDIYKPSGSGASKAYCTAKL